MFHILQSVGLHTWKRSFLFAKCFPVLAQIHLFTPISRMQCWHVQQLSKLNLSFPIVAIRFLSVDSSPINDALVVPVRLCFRYPIRPQPGFRHAQFNRGERVENRGNRTEIMVVIIAETNVIYLCSIHYDFILKSNHSLGELHAAFFTCR